MSRSREKKVGQSKQAQTTKPGRRYRFELSFGRILLGGFGLVVLLAWMFIFGILVGRGIPVVDPKEASLRGDFMRFMGLARESTTPPENAAATWEESEEMLKSLQYYDRLTKNPPLSASKSATRVPVPTRSVPTQNLTPPSPSPSGGSSSSQSASVESDQTAQPAGSAETADARFTLMTASLKNLENAQRLVERLRAKGYAPRMETIEMEESGRWYRVLVGSFENRDQALQFAAVFNQKEHQQALVIEERR